MKFKKVLVANRGEIACRIIRTLKKLGITAIAIYSEADRNSPYVSLADEACLIGPPQVSESYLNISKIIDLCLSHKIDAVHPGYGLLSENPNFISALDHAKIKFIGPRVEHLESFGLKDKARILAEKAGVPLIPGSGLVSDLNQAMIEADRIGYPVMLKAAAGGGGIGMQRCENESSLKSVYESVIKLAKNNFSNSNVFLEKCIDRARHVEVQIFGDGEGNVITIGERDCSLQRRNQKVVEETPAQHLDEATRLAMNRVSKTLAEQHRYKSAGTVEYIYDCDTDQFYFLEVNTRLQVEHTVTEEVFGMDLVEWMIRLEEGDLSFWPSEQPKPDGHSIQARIYAEDPVRDFQPCTGEISHWSFGGTPRIDSAVEVGNQVSPFYDPLLAKVVVKAENRNEALRQLQDSLEQSVIGGVQTNTAWLCKILKTPEFQEATITTKYIAKNKISPDVVEVLRSGVQTTVQDYPGRRSMWDVGVPPSGPMDDYSFRIGNSILHNDVNAAGLECLLQGPKLKFHVNTSVCVTGAEAEIKLNGKDVEMYSVIPVEPNDVLDVGKVLGQGSRIYILFAGGIQTPIYLKSRSTFTLGKFGGHCGRPILVGDSLPLPDCSKPVQQKKSALVPKMKNHWDIHVMMGPHTAPEFFTPEDIQEILNVKWKVHFNSDRTGVRLIGPQPKWAREDGGEAGLHPSNIHDNAYAIGAMDFTGDQPVLLGPDGPSLGGFVCPLTIIKADLWKMGQLRSDDEINFIPVNYEKSQELLSQQETSLQTLQLESKVDASSMPVVTPILVSTEDDPKLVIRQSGDQALLCEFGNLELDLDLRIHVHFFMEEFKQTCIEFIQECTPGIRSIQIQFRNISRAELIQRCIAVHEKVIQQTPRSFHSRIIHLPLSWNDPSTLLAIEKYVTSVRPDAPWCCPDNIEFIRRVNGLHSVDEVKEIVYNAKYLVMGLGDVYLGAPVAVPVDPRHRLITTKYNPARTWTPENAVGIGGAYMCIYGMEGPGGYQFVGRTLPVWNRFKKTDNFSNPYLLRFFDQISFFEVSPEELLEYREAFIHGHYKIKIEETEFDIQTYKKFLSDHKDSCHEFKQKQTKAFEAEKQRWIEQGVFSFDSATSVKDEEVHEVPPGATAITSPVSGAVWKIVANENDQVEEDEQVMILEAMKMEMGVYAPCQGKLGRVFVEPGQTVEAGQCLGYIT